MAFRRSRTTTRRRTSGYRRTRSRRFARPWTRNEIAFMRKFYRNYETAWIARQMGRSVYSVRYKAVDLNLKKANPTIWRGNVGSPNSFRSLNRGGGHTVGTTRVGRSSRPRRYGRTHTSRRTRRHRRW
jgi:hypothetical protein